MAKCEAAEMKFQVSANIKSAENKNGTISQRIISQPKEHDNGDYICATHIANKVVVLLMCSKHLRFLSKVKVELNPTYFSRLLF